MLSFLFYMSKVDLILTPQLDRTRVRNPLPKLIMFLMADGMHQPFVSEMTKGQVEPRAYWKNGNK